LSAENLTTKFADVIGWERRKRRERLVADAFCLSWGLAILAFPLHVYLPDGPWRWLVPLVLLAGVGPCLAYCARWRRADTTRAVLQLDKMLRLAERAITAWEITARPAAGGAALLVLKQADDRLRAVEPRSLFPRRRSWSVCLALPLFGLWFALLWRDFDRQLFRHDKSLTPPTLAYRLREFARELQERARSEGLHESLKMGEELEKVARQAMDAKASDDELKSDAGGVARKFEAETKARVDQDSFTAGESRRSLEDLKAELEAARDLMQLPGAAGEQPAAQWMERLAALPQLRRHLQPHMRPGQSSTGNEIKSLLENLDRQVSGELDRRAVLDAQRYLEQMMKQPGRQDGEGHQYARTPGGDQRESPAGGEEDKSRGNRPGKEPGKRGEEYRSLPEFRAGASTQVKGLLGEGDSRAIEFKGKPSAGKSTLGAAEVVASYRRQAEQELNSERVPDALKETIRNYFMSLGAEEPQQK